MSVQPETTKALERPAAEPKVREDTCETHGAFEAQHIFGSIWTGCPTCADEAKAREAAATAAAAVVERSARIDRRILAAGITPRFRDRTFENFVVETQAQRDVLNTAFEFVGDFDRVMETGRSMVFVGSPGTGKTHLAVAIVQALIAEDRYRARVTTVMRLLRSVKETWEKGAARSESDAVQDYVKPDLLVLDEVGVQFGSPTEKNILFDILNERYERLRPTILLSNLTNREVTEFLGDRIIDRLRENGGRYVVFDWDSWRKR